MSVKALFFTFCLVYCVFNIDATFIKPNNVPRIGRSNEAEFDQGNVGFVIKTKNIPRMGRRNFDSGNNYDIPKFYQLPGENNMYPQTLYQDEGQLEAYYDNLRK